MEISTIIQLISITLATTLNFILILVALKKKKDAKNVEEQQKMDDIINDQMTTAISNIKNLCQTNNLIYNAKLTKQAVKKIIKENKKNDNNKTNIQ